MILVSDGRKQLQNALFHFVQGVGNRNQRGLKAAMRQRCGGILSGAGSGRRVGDEGVVGAVFALLGGRGDQPIHLGAQIAGRRADRVQLEERDGKGAGDFS